LRWCIEAGDNIFWLKGIKDLGVRKLALGNERRIGLKLRHALARQDTPEPAWSSEEACECCRQYDSPIAAEQIHEIDEHGCESLGHG
jgi:hypothetical protein